MCPWRNEKARYDQYYNVDDDHDYSNNTYDDTITEYWGKMENNVS